MIEIIGRARDLKLGTEIVYAQIKLSDYLKWIGPNFKDFGIQRKKESHKAYGRLKEDIKNGALLPSITLSVKPERVTDALDKLADITELQAFLSESGGCDILDGLQRTFAIQDVSDSGVEFSENHKLLLEIWIEAELKSLIYRMIVLNSGQKPMSSRHQIELLFSSLKGSIEKRVPGIELISEKDNRRRSRAKIFPMNVIVSGYQSYVSGSTELNKDNLITQQLQVDSSLNGDEETLSAQFNSFIEYLKFYSDIDDEIFRIYVADSNGKSEYQHWMSNENNCISFFAAIAQFLPEKDSSFYDNKAKRIEDSLNILLETLKQASAGDDPLFLDHLEAVRRGANARKVNIGSYTRRTLCNGYKEYFRESGDISFKDAWSLAVD